MSSLDRESPYINSTADGPGPQDDSGASSPDPQFVAAVFVIVLASLIIFLAALTLPRLFALLNHDYRKSRIFSSGWFLEPPKSATTRAKDVPGSNVHLPPALSTRRANDVDDAQAQRQEEIYPPHLHRHLDPRHEGRSVGAPKHVPAWSTLLHSLPGAPWFSRAFWPGLVNNLSNGKAVMFLVYAVGFVVAVFLMDTGTDNIDRAGWLVVAQTPLVVSLGTKNSLAGFFLGRGYEKINFMHRWIGRLMFISAVFHVCGYSLQKDAADSGFEAKAAFGGFILIAALSLPIVRRFSYRLFFHAHWVGYVTFLVAICFHVDGALYWVLAAVFFLGLDSICRLAKSHLMTVRLTPLPALRATRVEVPQLTRGWKAGQHLRLRVFSLQMGIMSLGEAHPFTIASVADSEQGVVLYIKAAGDWSRQLYDIASEANDEEKLQLKMNVSNASLETLSRDEIEEGAGVFAAQQSSQRSMSMQGFGSGARTMQMVVEGPYGGSEAYVMRSSFTAALIVCGGSGITYGLSVVEEMIRDVERLESRVRLIDFVWVVTDPACLIPVLPVVTSLLDRASYGLSLRFSLTVHYTRTVSPSFSDKLRALPGGGLPRNITVATGRPDFSAVVGGFVSKTSTLARGSGKLSGVLVGVCGPIELGKAVKQAVDVLDGESKRGVGGVEVEEEVFGW